MMVENEDRLSNEEVVTNLVNWLTLEHPCKMKISPNVKIMTDAYGGIGLYYEHNEKLPITNEIIHIPSHFFINKLTCLKHIEKKLKEGNETWLKIFGTDYKALLKSIKDDWNSFDTIILYVYVEWFCLPTKSFHLPFFQSFPSSSFFEENIPVLQILRLEDKSIDTTTMIDMLSIEFRTEFDKLYNNIKASESHLTSLLLSGFGEADCAQTIKDRIRYLYMCINSRCLYYEISRTSSNKEDNLTLVPFVDFINHSNKQEEVNAIAETTKNFLQLDKQDYKIFYQETSGKEILFKYGHHSDDLLLNDYGFILNEPNENNCFDVTDIIMKKLKQCELDYLLEANLYKENDRFLISSEKSMVYHNTAIAIYMISLNKELPNLKNLKTFSKPKQLKLDQFMKSSRTNSIHYQNEIFQILEEYKQDLKLRYKFFQANEYKMGNVLELINKKLNK